MMKNQSSKTPASPQTPPARRSFLASLAALGTGAIAALVPLGAGLAAFLTPLFRKNSSVKVRLALLDHVPDDGVPRMFPVVAERRDAWTRYPQQRLGSVYLVRAPGTEKPLALTAKCPHAGCFIGYVAGDDQFRCPCHTSAFRLDGARSRGDEEVAPRDMDRLAVDLKATTSADGTISKEVWIDFVDFQTGHKEAVPTA